MKISIIFSLKCCITALLDFNQSLLDCQPCWLTTLTTHNHVAVYDSQNLVVIGVKLWALEGLHQEEGSSEFHAVAIGLRCVHNAPVRYLAIRHCHPRHVEIVTYPSNSPLILCRSWWRTTPILLQRPTLSQAW